MISLNWRLSFSAIVFLAALALSLPSLPDTGFLHKYLPDKKINLGLDLKGGMYLTLGVEVEKAVTNSLGQTGQELRRRAAEKNIVILSPRILSDGRLEFTLGRADQESALRDLLGAAEDFAALQLGSPTALPSGSLRFTATYSDSYASKIEDMALDQAVRTIRNRIDQFGVAEPDIRKQSEHRIQIQLPGLDDPQRAIELVGRTAQLTFHLVRTDLDPEGILPPDTMVLPRVSPIGGQDDEPSAMLVINRDALLSGEDLTDARVSLQGNEYQRSAHVSIHFSSRGAGVFERITGENVGRRLAIVLDGKVYSDPVINERIAGGAASISGRFTVNEAQDLAIVLRAGSLPAPVSVLEERTVGPTLGRDSIQSGIMAAIVGSLGVIIVMAVYYGIAGIIADLMLMFTILLLMAGMAAFGATLTLPGIAGIVLTVGMAIDANILIYERIREELRAGMTAIDAVLAGFSRATITITDSNLTSIIATAILYQFGTGPIRGFAVTLSLGIFASMFTSIFVSRGIFLLWLRLNGGKSISI
jgi:preprotein translocase subunit SecD